jgi:hypothetical protein
MRVGSVAAAAAVVVAVVAAVALLHLLPKMNGIQWRRQRPVFFSRSPTVHTHPLAKPKNGRISFYTSDWCIFKKDQHTEKQF